MGLRVPNYGLLIEGSGTCCWMPTFRVLLSVVIVGGQRVHTWGATGRVVLVWGSGPIISM